MLGYSFQPKTEEELNKNELIENGTYDFEVIRSTRKTSKKGNSMAELNIRIWDKAGKIHEITDYLVFSTMNLNIRKIKHFCETTGLIKEYESGQLPDQLGGYSGKCEIGLQQGQENPNGGYYPDKNVIVDYIKSDKKVDDFKQDDIPF